MSMNQLYFTNVHDAARVPPYLQDCKAYIRSAQNVRNRAQRRDETVQNVAPAMQKRSLTSGLSLPSNTSDSVIQQKWWCWFASLCTSSPNIVSLHTTSPQHTLSLNQSLIFVLLKPQNKRRSFKVAWSRSAFKISRYLWLHLAPCLLQSAIKPCKGWPLYSIGCYHSFWRLCRECKEW